MNNETWQQLLSLESRDVTSKWFGEIHSRELNARRAKEINSAAKQAREYFRNAANSNYSVRPLLTFYGVASLSRALLLLLKKSGGEESLTGSHGLETVAWVDSMSGDVSKGLKNLENLKVRTCRGLFADFITQTENRLSVHVNSSAVDWHVCYDIPELGKELSVKDILSRLPDLRRDFEVISKSYKYSDISEMTYSDDKGFRAKVRKEPFNSMRSHFEQAGYSLTDENEMVVITSDSATFAKNLPLFVHSYIHKTFGTIPSLHISEPFPANSHYSQLCITYMTSYILGMLVRYYPTHWMALSSGDKGDEWWPLINRSQQYVEHAFPELVIELINDILKKSKESQGSQSNA